MRFPKKSLGQNFLIDKNIIIKIVSLVKVKNNHIIEIGPGKGALTDEILKQKPKSLVIIEKDEDLSFKLKEKYSKNKAVKVITADILKFNFEQIVSKNTIIFGNLPYNISSQILIKILKIKDWPPFFSGLILMFQKELGEKIIGKFETKHYGRISIFVNFRLKFIKKFLVSNNCFFPKPKVKSQVIYFKPKKESKFSIRDINNLEKITHIFFSNKRKMINKKIKGILSDNQIKRLKEIKLNLRPTDLRPELYYKITELYEEIR
tara:strand:- start:3999 stop:4787 length:789 start_codon:yes stop_codon:yes gene_type:complete